MDHHLIKSIEKEIRKKLSSNSMCMTAMNKAVATSCALNDIKPDGDSIKTFVKNYENIEFHWGAMIQYRINVFTMLIDRGVEVKTV